MPNLRFDPGFGFGFGFSAKVGTDAGLTPARGGCLPTDRVARVGLQESEKNWWFLRIWGINPIYAQKGKQRANNNELLHCRMDHPSQNNICDGWSTGRPGAPATGL